MDKQTYYSNALQYLLNKYPENKFTDHSSSSLELKFWLSDDDTDFRILGLSTPYEYSRNLDFNSWKDDLEQFFTQATQIITDFSNIPWDEIKKNILPQIKRRDQLENAMTAFPDAKYPVVFTEFLEDLVVGYVIDQPSGFTYVTGDLIEEWEVSLDDLNELALKNLQNLSETQKGPKEIPNGDGTVSYCFESNDGFDASRILLSSLHSTLSSFFGGPYIVAIPCRDFMFVAGPDYIDKLADFSAMLYEQNAHPITPQILSFGN